MQDRHKIYIALPRHPAIRSALENALRAASNLGLGNYDLTDKIDDAEVVVTDSGTQVNEIGLLPDSVRFLQLIDCGTGAPNISNDDLTVANASSLLVHDPADWAIDQWHEIERLSSRTLQNGPNIAGIIGFGSLGYEIGRKLSELGAKTWVNDIRTPKQMSFQSVGARRSSLDMLLSTSDIVFVAVHHGPTSDPLLSRRELRLLEIGATVINMSSEKVVDREAIKTLNEHQEQSIDYREMPYDLGSASASRRPRATTSWVLDNLGNYALNRQPRSIVEQVTHPLAGDPAFWASRMHPRQTPV